MIDECKLVKMSSLFIKDTEMMTVYASLGYFNYQYVNSLNNSNSCIDLVKDNGVIKCEGTTFEDGSYLKVSIVDAFNKRKNSILYWYPRYRLDMTVGDLNSILAYVCTGLRINVTNCFVKFDIYTIDQ